MQQTDHTARGGFTLIELSIVLVIIGLIVGGVLVGQDLVRAAGERATISQIEKFNTAANSFYGKYGYLPGDIPAGPAAQMGFTARGTNYGGEGDGNGLIQGRFTASSGCGAVQDIGETVMFWEDLTYANGLKLNFIDGNFNAAADANTFLGMLTGSSIATVFPSAKLGNGNYIYVYSTLCGGNPYNTSKNYYGLSTVTSIYNDIEYSCQYCIVSSAGLTVRQAYDIDSKIDDGKPTTGNVIAQYLSPNNFSGGWGMSASAAAPSSTTCYDTTSTNYSMTVSGGSNITCGLSFRVQAGD